MDTAVINIRVDPKVKSQFQKVAEELGLGVSTLIDALMRQVIRTKRVELEVRPEIPNAYLLECLRKSEEERLNGDFYSFEKPDDALAFLDKIIDESKKKKNAH